MAYSYLFHIYVLSMSLSVFCCLLDQNILQTRFNVKNVLCHMVNGFNNNFQYSFLCRHMAGIELGGGSFLIHKHYSDSVTNRLLHAATSILSKYLYFSSRHSQIDNLQHLIETLYLSAIDQGELVIHTIYLSIPFSHDFSISAIIGLICWNYTDARILHICHIYSSSYWL